MPPSILIAGSTGNTGVGVVEHLSSVLPNSANFSKHRLLALTRDAQGETAQRFAQLPHVEVIEKNWSLINADWLRQHEVERIFIASQVGVSQFADESLFLTYALEAGVKYVVRISTTRGNIGPATRVFYGRNHWAIETMLDQPEFDSLKWTSLQPNVFTSQFTGLVTNWVKQYRKDGTKLAFKNILDGDKPVAVIDAYEVGLIAGHLLALDDVTPHASRKYRLVGPSDANGKDVVKLIEKHAGTTVDDVTFRDTSFVEYARQNGVPENVLASLALAPSSSFDGSQSVQGSPTSPEIIKLYAPKNGFLDALDAELAKV